MPFNLVASASKTSIKVLPIIFLFCSGSATPFKCLKKISSLSDLITFRFMFSLNVFITSSASPFLRRPLSTNTHTSLLPIASCKSAAVTEESTPPERPSKTLLS